MATAEARGPAREGRSSSIGRARAAAWGALAVVLAGGLALRLWGVRQGLPFAYNTDEAQHFVPRAIRMFAEGTLDPRYFANPPAYTYLLHLLFGAWYGSGAAAVRAFALHPAGVYTLARVLAALLGALALWLLYLVGARLFDRGVGLLAAAIEAVAFLPVFYSHLALNDVPTMAPATLSLLGSAGILRRGRLRDHLLAGVGLGLACASKYTAGIMLLPLLAALAAGTRSRGPDRGQALGPLAGLLVAGSCAMGAFLLANPFALLDWSRFSSELAQQSSQSAEAQGKLGSPRDGGLAYYLWTLTWGLGWVPALASLAGAVQAARRRPQIALMLVPAALVFLLFMGLEGRYFGRWLLPAFPLLCLLGAYAALEPARLLARRAGRPAAAAAAAVAVAALLVQGLLYSVHDGLVLSRPDTRNLTRAWMVAHIPAGARVVVEPVAPDEWANVMRPGTATASNPPLWHKYASEYSRVGAAGQLREGPPVHLSIEDYERTLAPALLSYYRSHGYCWVVSGSTQSGRARADPGAVPLAIAYYRALASSSTVLYRASPYSPGAHPPGFNFDWSFDYYPLAYERPGPAMTVYRLRGCG